MAAVSDPPPQPTGPDPTSNGAAPTSAAPGSPAPFRFARRALGKVVRLLLAVGICWWLVQGGWLDLDQLKRTRFDRWLLASVLLLLGIVVVPPLRWWLLLRARGLPLSFWKTFHVSLLGSLAGKLLFGMLGNDAVRLGAMARLCPHQRPLAVSTVALDRYLGALSLFALGPLAVLALWVSGAREPWLYRLGVGVGGLLVAALLLPILASHPRAAGWLGPLGRRPAVQKLHAALAGYRGHGKVLAIGLALSLVGHLGYVGGCACALRAMGYQVDLLGVTAVVPLVVLSRQVPLTPQGLGIKEGVSDALFRLTGMEGGAEMALLVRVILMAQAVASLPALLIRIGGPVPGRPAADPGEGLAPGRPEGEDAPLG
jgi:uncharacterized membrane protein YbhN (UPF0104 family)